jgi:hypothetical protein
MRKEIAFVLQVAVKLSLLALLLFALPSIGLTQQLGPLLSQDRVINTTPTSTLQSEVAFDGVRYLIVFNQNFDTSYYYEDVYARFVDTTGNMEPPFLIAHGQQNQREAAVAFNGTNYLVAWEDNLGGRARLRGQLVSPTGVLIGGEIEISPALYARDPEVASDGEGFLIVWTQGDDIVGQMIAGTGGLIGSNFMISPDEQYERTPAIAFGISKYLVTWTHTTDIYSQERDVYGALVSQQGAVSSPIAISTAPGSQGGFDTGIAFGVTDFLVVFENYNGSPTTYMGARVSENGNVLDGPLEENSIQISGEMGGQGAAAFDGTNWVVIGAGYYGPAVRVDQDGSVLDQSALSTFINLSLAFESALAFDGTNFLVTARSYTNPKTKYAQLVGEVTINVEPVSDAGPDQTVDEGTVVTLDASGSNDPNGDILVYEWTQLAGPSVALDESNPVHPTFVAPLVSLGGATITFGLTVNDGQTASSQDQVSIAVKNVNHAPVADAGNDQTVGPFASVTLDGSASYDQDGDALSFSWVQTQGPTVELTSAAEFEVSFLAPLVEPPGATLLFELTVSDGFVGVTDTVVVNVENANHTPIANAGVDIIVNEGSNVTLNGALSYDSDGDPLTYNWQQLDGVPVSLTNPTTATPNFNAPPVALGGDNLLFELRVFDGLVYSQPDQVLVNVLNVNDPPMCELASADISILWPPTHKMIEVEITGLSDPNNDLITTTIIGVTQDEPTNFIGDGDSSPDAVIQEDTVLLRAERSGNGNGRVYLIVFVASDSIGGICEGSVLVTVPSDRKSQAIDDGQVFDSILP